MGFGFDTFKGSTTDLMKQFQDKAQGYTGMQRPLEEELGKTVSGGMQAAAGGAMAGAGLASLGATVMSTTGWTGYGAVVGGALMLAGYLLD